jgi:hypothetical protein
MVSFPGGTDRSAGGSTSIGLIQEDPELDKRYHAYRIRQAQGLISLLPRDAIRPLYSRARAWAVEAGAPPGKDPLALLLLFLEDLMPLPPFEVWVGDRASHLEAHVEEEFASGPAHRRNSPPVTVASRGLDLGGHRWQASLRLFRRDEAWRGFIAFRNSDKSDPLRTADIFREEDPEEIRSRFLAFHNETLEAFLRSVMA